MRKTIGLLFAGSLAVVAGDWNAQKAAEYMDGRQKVWFAWSHAAAPGGPCVSCHTGLTYLLARPALRRVLHEGQPTSYETGLLAGFRSRIESPDGADVYHGSRKEPFASQATGVESILSALCLVMDDRAKGSELTPEAQRALVRMWAAGTTSEGWAWFSLKLDPWEMPQSRFFGTSLALLTVGMTPDSYRNQPEIRRRIARLADRLQAEQQSQPLHNRLTWLWAASRLRDAMPESTRQQLLEELFRNQSSDGGWSLQALGPWPAHPNAPASATGSNAYGTAFATFIAQEAGVPHDDVRLVRAVSWLRAHQDSEGYWHADSMNKHYDAGSIPSEFMRDAATAYAVLALSHD